MRDDSFVTLDVFTDTPFGGNPLAVFPDADGLDDPTMQKIAAELNLSETVFVVNEGSGPPGLRIFTPKAELPFAGHPTVGAAIALVLAGKTGGRSTFALRTRAGLVQVETRTQRHGRMEAFITVPRLPTRGPAPTRQATAAVLGLLPEELAGEPVGYEAGVPFTFVPVADRGSLARAGIDTARWSSVFHNAWGPQIYVFSMTDWQHGNEIDARMFAPGLGIVEDPATGAAAAALAGLLVDRQQPRDGHAAWTILQGEDMGRPSRIALEASIRAGELVEVRLGGTAVPMTEGRFRV